MVFKINILVSSLLIGSVLTIPAHLPYSKQQYSKPQQVYQQSPEYQPSESHSFSAYAAPAPSFHSSSNNVIPILKLKSEVNHDGSYNYGYETGNGIAAEESGSVKNAGYADNEIQTAQGYFAYTGTDGKQYSVSYIADENGFRAEGAHLPKAPEIPPEILKALNSLPKDDNEYDDNGFPIKKYNNNYSQQSQRY